MSGMFMRHSVEKVATAKDCNFKAAQLRASHLHWYRYCWYVTGML